MRPRCSPAGPLPSPPHCRGSPRYLLRICPPSSLHASPPRCQVEHPLGFQLGSRRPSPPVSRHSPQVVPLPNLRAVHCQVSRLVSQPRNPPRNPHLASQVVNQLRSPPSTALEACSLLIKVMGWSPLCVTTAPQALTVKEIPICAPNAALVDIQERGPRSAPCVPLATIPRKGPPFASLAVQAGMPQRAPRPV